MQISKREALGILNIVNPENAGNAYEEMLFTWKQKYLSIVPPLKIISAHIVKIERLQCAANCLIEFSSYKSQMICPDIIDQSLEQTLHNYQDALMNIRLRISSSQSALELVDALFSLKYLSSSLNSKLATYYPIQSVNANNNAKISAPSDYYQAQKELIEKQISETEIMNYLRTELKFGSYPFDSVLLNEVLKAKKHEE